ncbi:MAG TPA: ABC transporter permease [Acetobacteraceae bacterium]
MIERRCLLPALALQNVARRKLRTALLAAAVAVSCAVVFAGGVLLRSIVASMSVGFNRLGADLMVVPAEARINITAGLLTVEPTEQTVAAHLLDGPLAGIARAAPQRVFRTDQSGFGGHGDSVDLIGFDIERDFTVQPWITERLGRRMHVGDVIIGAARDVPVGGEIALFGRPFRIYAKLGRSGVGTHERAIFMTVDDLLSLTPAVRERSGGVPPVLQPDRVSGFLLQLAPGTTEVQARFALLSRLPGIKVVAGEALMTGVRQSLEALFGGALLLVAMAFVSTAIMVAVLFSAIIAERRGELGLLKAIGARRWQIVGLMTTEAMIVTGGGGVLGVVFGELLLRLFARSVVFHLNEMGVGFVWLDTPGTVLIGALCLGLAALTGAVGALVPAWRASRRDAYELILGSS